MQSSPASPLTVLPVSRLQRVARWGVVLFAALGFSLSAPLAAANTGPGPSLTRADRAAIQAVINLQMKALAADEDNGAFALAAPDVRRQFGTAEAFMDMVRKGYPPLFRNQSTAFLEAAIIDDDVIQPLRITNRDGTVVIALFSMERQSNGDWRVYGCQLAPSDLQAA